RCGGFALIGERFPDRKKLVGFDVLDQLLGAAGPLNFDRCNVVLTAKAEMHSLVCRTHQAHTDCNMIKEDTPRASRELHGSADRITTTIGPDQAQPQPMLSIVRGVEQNA